jgi:hypothetical protein
MRRLYSLAWYVLSPAILVWVLLRRGWRTGGERDGAER